MFGALLKKCNPVILLRRFEENECQEKKQEEPRKRRKAIEKSHTQYKAKNVSRNLKHFQKLY